MIVFRLEHKCPLHFAVFLSFLKLMEYCSAQVLPSIINSIRLLMHCAKVKLKKLVLSISCITYPDLITLWVKIINTIANR
jgi:hypothetical protein